MMLCSLLFSSLTYFSQPLDLKSYSVSIHIFTLNEDGPSTLSLEEDEELSAANHWLLPAGTLTLRSAFMLSHSFYFQWKSVIHFS